MTALQHDYTDLCSVCVDLRPVQRTMFTSHKDLIRSVISEGQAGARDVLCGKTSWALVRCSTELAKVTSWNPSACQYWAIQGSICSHFKSSQSVQCMREIYVSSSCIRPNLRDSVKKQYTVMHSNITPLNTIIVTFIILKLGWLLIKLGSDKLYLTYRRHGWSNILHLTVWLQCITIGIHWRHQCFNYTCAFHDLPKWKTCNDNTVFQFHNCWCRAWKHPTDHFTVINILSMSQFILS